LASVKKQGRSSARRAITPKWKPIPWPSSDVETLVAFQNNLSIIVLTEHLIRLDFSPEISRFLERKEADDSDKS